MANEVRLIGCRSCDSKNCSGCNLLTLEEMLCKGDFDCLMDESRSIVATPESLRPKGRWKGEGLGDYSCSLCTEIVSGNNYNYCHICGAKMEG